MVEGTQISGEINIKTDLEKVFTAIRGIVEIANSHSDLTELYNRAGYLITLIYEPSWVEKFGRDALVLRKIGEQEFRKTARWINRRAKQIGAEAIFDEDCGALTISTISVKEWL